jgi:hypothetical protein
MPRQHRKTFALNLVGVLRIDPRIQASYSFLYASPLLGLYDYHHGLFSRSAASY